MDSNSSRRSEGVFYVLTLQPQLHIKIALKHVTYNLKRSAFFWHGNEQAGSTDPFQDTFEG